MYLISYLPATVATAEVFASLAKTHFGKIVLLEKFPVDELFEE
jgi:hypothetical protein